MNNDLAVASVFELKRQLEDGIYNLIENFSKVTGLTVTGVDVEATKSTPLDGLSNTLYFIEVEVHL